MGIIRDTLTIQIQNDSTGVSKSIQIVPPHYVNNISSSTETSTLQVSLAQLTQDFSYSDPRSALALKNYRFDLYINHTLVTKIDSIKTGIVLIDECYDLNCAQVTSFRENGQPYTDIYNHLVRY